MPQAPGLNLTSIKPPVHGGGVDLWGPAQGAQHQTTHPTPAHPLTLGPTKLRKDLEWRALKQKQHESWGHRGAGGGRGGRPVRCMNPPTGVHI
jgi:hypothetical protein